MVKYLGPFFMKGTGRLENDWAMERVNRILLIIFVMLFVITFVILGFVISRSVVTKAPWPKSFPFIIVLMLLFYGACSIFTGLVKRNKLALDNALPQWYKQTEIRIGVFVEFIGIIALIVFLIIKP